MMAIKKTAARDHFKSGLIQSPRPGASCFWYGCLFGNLVGGCSIRLIAKMDGGLVILGAAFGSPDNLISLWKTAAGDDDDDGIRHTKRYAPMNSEKNGARRGPYRPEGIGSLIKQTKKT